MTKNYPHDYAKSLFNKTLSIPPFLSERANAAQSPFAAEAETLRGYPNRQRVAVKFRVEPAVAQPAPPQIRT